MTEYTVRSLVIICPIEQIEAIDQMAESIGYKAGFSIPLSADGTGEPTHKGLHATARKHFLWLVTGQPDEVPAIPDEPTPLTEEEYEALATAEAALTYPDPESETFEADKAAYHEQLTAVRAPINAYNAAARERSAAEVKAQQVQSDLAVYNSYVAALSDASSEAAIDALRSVLIVSADPIVNDITLRGTAHVTHVAQTNGLQLITDDVV
jgi:hypothetical protein